MKSKHCQWCDHAFETEISYQIYCCAECREAATKEKIAARYNQTRRTRRKGKDRPCKNCGKQLSIYNDGDLCETCVTDPRDLKGALKEIKRLINGKE
jgi:hypothetical protein